MNREEIIRMAREAGFETLLPHEHIHGTGGVYVGDDNIAVMLERFAAIVAAAEREACAKVLDDWKKHNWTFEDCAAAIRARGKE